MSEIMMRLTSKNGAKAIVTANWMMKTHDIALHTPHIAIQKIRKDGTKRNSKAVRGNASGFTQGLIYTMMDKNMAVIMSTTTKAHDEVYMLSETVRDTFYILSGDKEILYKAPFDNIIEPEVWDKNTLTEQYMNIVYGFYDKFKGKREVKRDNKTKTTVNLSNSKEYKEYEEYLLKSYKEIGIQRLNIADAEYIAKRVCESHQMMSKIINLTVYPKLNYLQLTPPKNNNKGYFYHDLGITVRLTQDVKQRKWDLPSTYFHEYGHYIHYYYIKISENAQHNLSVFNDMVKDLRKTESVQRLRAHYSRDSAYHSYRTYLMKGSELIARMFESYCLYKAGYYDSLSIKDKMLLYTEEEHKIFIKYMVRLKL